VAEPLSVVIPGVSPLAGTVGEALSQTPGIRLLAGPRSNAADVAVMALTDDSLRDKAIERMRTGTSVCLMPPFASSIEPLLDLRRVAADADVTLGALLGSRHHPRSLALRRSIREGAIGKLALMRHAQWVPTHGQNLPIEAVALGSLDLLAFLGEVHPRKVYATERVTVRHRLLIAHLMLEGNLIATVELHQSSTLAAHEDLLLVGTEGVLRAGTRHDNLVSCETARGITVLGDGMPRSAGLVAAFQETALAMREGRTEAGIRDALRAVATWAAIRASIEQGHAVEVTAEGLP
jgi:predicted dehydrogenase